MAAATGRHSRDVDEGTGPVAEQQVSARRRLRPWVVLSLVALAAAVIAVAGWLVATSPEEDGAAPPGPSAGSDAADGCLGGAADPQQAALTARVEAPHTGDGAAAFLATVLRWTSAITTPAELELVAPQVMSGDFPPAQLDLLADEIPESVASGAAATLVGRHYDVLDWDGATARVALTTGYTRDGADAGQRLSVMVAVLTDDGWRWAGQDDQAVLALSEEDGDQGLAALERLDATGVAFRNPC